MTSKRDDEIFVLLHFQCHRNTKFTILMGVLLYRPRFRTKRTTSQDKTDHVPGQNGSGFRTKRTTFLEKRALFYSFYSHFAWVFYCIFSCLFLLFLFVEEKPYWAYVMLHVCLYSTKIKISMSMSLA